MLLLNSLQELIKQHGVEKTYWIGYSGGMDSHVLLMLCHLLSQTQPIRFHAIHVNHQINANAIEWAQHCQRTCVDLGIPYDEYLLQLPLHSGGSLEEMAREARYQQFANCLQPGDVLLTAHHQEDQAETVLLQLLRGAGLQGLSAMPIEKPFAKGFHARPLLQHPQAELLAYAAQQKLKWITDDSNYNKQFARNYLRHEIFPRLVGQWRGAAKTISRSAMHCAEAQSLLQEFAAEICTSVLGERPNTLSVSKLLKLPVARQRLVLRAWIQQQEFVLPNTNKLETILTDVLHAAWDKLPCVSWGEVELRRYRDELFLMAALPIHDPNAVYSWNFKQSIHVPGIGLVEAKTMPGQGIRRNIEDVTIQFRQGGEIATLPKRGRHTLKNLFNEWNVLPWERNRVPLLFSAKKLIAAVGFYIDPEYQADGAEEGWVVGVNG